MSHTSYLENEVMSATPGKLVLLLFEGVIRFLRRLDGLDYAQNIETKNYNIQKAYAIISELQVTLNMEYESISAPLFSLYNYMMRRLMEANVKNDATIVTEVINLISDLKETWAQVVNNPQGQPSEENVEQINALNPEEGAYEGFSMAG